VKVGRATTRPRGSRSKAGDVRFWAQSGHPSTLRLTTCQAPPKTGASCRAVSLALSGLNGYDLTLATIRGHMDWKLPQLFAASLLIATPTLGANPESCHLSTPSSAKIEKDPALRVTEVTRGDHIMQYAGSYKGVSFLFLIANCDSEVHQLAIMLPGNTDAWSTMEKLHLIFHMPATPMWRTVRAALQKKDHFTHAGGGGTVEFELRGAGVLQILSETINAQR